MRARITLTWNHRGRSRLRRCLTLRHSGGEAPAGEGTEPPASSPPQSHLEFLKNKEQMLHGSGALVSLHVQRGSIPARVNQKRCPLSEYLCQGVLPASPHRLHRLRCCCCCAFFSSAEGVSPVEGSPRTGRFYRRGVGAMPPEPWAASAGWYSWTYGRGHLFVCCRCRRFRCERYRLGTVGLGCAHWGCLGVLR